MPAPTRTADTPQDEAVPEAAIVDGQPRGMFVGRSLLTGRAVCLLFLSGGRVTRAIPAGGLRRFDWSRHRAEHGPDSGTWELRGEQLTIRWGDGGVHQGPLRTTPNGIEFYGKRYTRPVPVTLDALVGRWEAARGTAVAGGEGVNTASTLIVEPGGRYRWSGVIGGEVAGRSTALERSNAGTITIDGSTLSFHAEDGSVISRTFLPVPGEPLGAFSLDADLFTRSGA